MINLVSKDEIRRLEKAAREKDKKKLAEWMRQFEQSVDEMLRTDYEYAYQHEIEVSIQNLLTAVAYTAVFTEETKIDNEDIGDYMSDLLATLDMYRTGEYTPQEYKEELEKYGVFIEDYDYNGPYKKFLGIVDSDLVRFLSRKPRKIATICSNPKNKEEIIKVGQDLSLQNYIVQIDFLFADAPVVGEKNEEFFDNLQKDKIIISDLLYVINKDGIVDNKMQEQIDYAKAHNKEIRYLFNDD